MKREWKHGERVHAAKRNAADRRRCTAAKSSAKGAGIGGSSRGQADGVAPHRAAFQLAAADNAVQLAATTPPLQLAARPLEKEPLGDVDWEKLVQEYIESVEEAIAELIDGVQ